MFSEGFEKVAVIVPTLAGGLVGAVAGGEPDKETGHSKNKGIGAFRGAMGAAGGYIGTEALLNAIRASRQGKKGGHIKLNPAMAAAVTLAPAATGALGYLAARKIGRKYDFEKEEM